jgi:hypothetical protein
MPDYKALGEHRHLRPAEREKPLVLIVTPYCILPPRHGGARRVHALCSALASRWRFLLVSDDALSHRRESWSHAAPFEGVYLTAGRKGDAQSRIERMKIFSHAQLQAALDRLTALHRPALVQVEWMELAGLRPPDGVPSLLMAHDVLLGEGGADDEAERSAMARFDAIVACSSEDAALLAPFHGTVVANGAALRGDAAPSKGSGLLFAGPFAYRPNLVGIRAFLATVYPVLRGRCPDATLTVLGGPEGPSIAARDPVFAQVGVSVLGPVDDVVPYLSACALTINPQVGIRGSSVKVIESLGASRCCVSTRDGARGHAAAGLRGLILAEDVPHMLEPVAHLLRDAATRHRLERVDAESFAPLTWNAAAATLEGVYRQLMGATRP